jgi:hypothetical protein
VQALLAGWSQYRCAPREVSAGNWVGMDCGGAAPVLRVSQFQRPHTLVNAALPVSVDSREAGLEGPVKNQGAVGACTALSLSSAMEHELRRAGIQEPVSALHIWSNYGVGNMGRAGDSNVDKRLAGDSAWPYDPATACKISRDDDDSCRGAYGVTPNTASHDPQVMGEKTRADGAGKFGLVGIERVSGDPEELAAILAGGSDLWVAFNFNDAWESRNIQSGVIRDYAVGEDTGHAVVLAGYRTVGNGRQFLIHNSWGPSWGQNGYAWISDNMVRTQMRYAYRVRIGEPSGAPTPQVPGIPGLPSIPGLPQLPGLPGAQPANPGGTCPLGQAVDIIYQRCMPACAGGQPAAAGLCAPVIPGVPGASSPPAPAGKCPSGQGPDVMSGKCGPLCAGGLPTIGGLCLPHVQ